MRNRLAALLFVAMLSPQLAADWIVEVDNLYPPTGVAARSDGTTIFTTRGVYDLAADGSLRASSVLVSRKGRLQIESVTAAREGAVVMGVHITGDTKAEARPSIVRLDAGGRVVWARATDADWVTGMSHAIETADGDIFAVSRHGLDEMLILRLSPSGELRWARRLDRTDSESPRGLVATRDGGVLVISQALSRAAALTRLDAKGTIIWDRVYGSPEAGWGLYAAIELDDGGFIAAGRTRNISADDRNGWLLRVSAKGDIVWQKTLGGDGEDGLFAVTKYGPNAYAAAGGLTPEAGGEADTWIVLFDGNGRITGEVSIGLPEHPDGPTDPEHAYIDSIDGQIVFASPSRLALLAGKFHPPAASCKVMRSITTRTTTTGALASDVPLRNEAITATLTPIEVSARKASEKAETLCTWAATTAAAAPPPQAIAVEPASEETLFADRVANLLLARSFAQLDTLAAQLRTSRATFASGGSKLRAFYGVVASKTSLAALPGDGHQRLLDAWHAETGSATSDIARAARLYATAQLGRGAGTYDSLLPEDAQKHQRLLGEAMRLLSTVEKKGACDAPCFELQINAGTIGGWSTPLQKLLAADPYYWEVFDAAKLYTSPNWGGTPGDIPRFVEKAAAETKATLGESVYALHHAGWRFDVTYFPGQEPPRPDWTRVRAGFRDFLRLHPGARWAAHASAAAAYQIARDRETARELFRSPLLEWRAGTVWRNRAEYDRAKAWALAEPVDPIVKTLAAGRLPSQRLVIAENDGTVKLMAAAPAGPVEVIVKPATGIVQMAAGSPRHVLNLQPLTVRTTPPDEGDILYVVGTEVIRGRAFQSGIKTEKPVDWKRFIGSPVFDDRGALAGVLMPGPAGGRPERVQPLHDLQRAR